MANEESRHWTDTDELVIQRIVELVEAAITAEPDEERRQLLQEYFDDGDFGIQPTGRPGIVLVTVGDDDIGEVPAVSLSRPDEPGRN